MKYIFTHICALLIAVTFGLGAYGENTYFAHSLEDAVALSESTGKPLLVIFSADWCKYCQVLKQELTDNDMQSALDEYLICIVDVDERKDLKDEYKVQTLPDSRLLMKLKERSSFIGYSGKKKYLAWIRNARNQ